MLPFEKMWWQKYGDPNRESGYSMPPVFIIGAPRSGTTLFSQIFLNAFKVGYFSNTLARFAKTPVMAAKRYRHTFHNMSGTDFKSDFGRTQGRYGAHEAAEFWYRWFPRGHHIYIDRGGIPADTLSDFAAHVRALGHVIGLPMMFKNTFNSMRLIPISQALPEAVFLVCRRDPVDNAQSILNARIKEGDKHEWWSVPPREYDEIRKHPYYQQVVDQVYYIEQQIEQDEQTIANDRFISVDYKAVCTHTRDTLESIRKKCTTLGLELQYRDLDLPDSFKYSTGCKTDPDDYAKIKERVAELWGR